MSPVAKSAARLGFFPSQALRSSGTHQGDLNGIAATGKQFAISGISVTRFTNGKMIEGWVNWDALGMMQQLGLVAELGKAKAATG
jgi:predicted ester cyclase